MTNNQEWYTAEDDKTRRARALGMQFQKTNRIVSGDPKICVKIQNSTDKGAIAQYIGYSMYPNIHINVDKFGDPNSPAVVAQLLGLSYHELCHLLFTPGGWKDKNLSTKYWKSFNMLEDMRIESLFTALYEPSGKYFTQLVIKEFVKKTETWSAAFVLTYGRSYLPLEIRDEFEYRFAKPNQIKMVKSLIDRYKNFTSADFWDNDKKAVIVDTIEKYHQILQSLKAPEPCGDPDPGRNKPNPVKEKDAQQKEKERREKEDETGEDQSGFWEDDEDEEGENESDDDGDSTDTDSEPEDDPDEDEEGGSDSEDEEDGDSDGDGDSSGDGFGEDGEDGEDSSDSGEGDEHGSGDDDSSQGGSGAGDDPEGELTNSDFREYLKDVVDAVNGDDAVQNEVNQILDAANDPTNLDFLDFNQPCQVRSPQQLTIEVKERITEEYRRLYATADPGWLFGSDEGRLNTQRAMLDPTNYDEMFDDWDAGREDATGVEVVMALDVSISMDGKKIQEATEVLWAIKHSLELVGSKVTVVGFHAATVGLIERDDEESSYEVREKWPLGGNTLPAGCLHVARAILNATQMPNKLFVIITDGSWANHDDRFPGVANLPDLVTMIPGHRMYVGIGSSGSNLAVKNEFHFVVELSGANEMMKLVDLTAQAVQRMVSDQISNPW